MLKLDLDEMQKPQKTFLELRYEEAFSLPENKYKILNQFKGKFDGRDIQQDRISLNNSEQQIQYHILLNRLIIDWDKPTSIKEFARICKPIINIVSNVLEINKFQRAGIRTHLENPAKSSEEVHEFIGKKFLSKAAGHFETLGGKNISNPNISFNGNNGNLQYNLAIRYQQKQMIEGRLNNPITNHIKNSLLFDIDTFNQGNLKIADVNSLLINAERFIKNNVISYLQAVEEGNSESE